MGFLVIYFYWKVKKLFVLNKLKKNYDGILNLFFLKRNLIKINFIEDLGDEI